MSDDESSISDSSDDSGHSSLHASSGPVMGGKGPGQLDWMNKFTKAKSKAPANNAGAETSAAGRVAPERRGIVPSSSFKRGESEKPPQPEWMNKFQSTSKKSDVSDSRERSPSPTRESVLSQAIPPNAPTTPGWMKQFRKGPAVAGAPSMPPIAPAPPVATASEPAPSAEASSESQKGKGKSSKKDWKALLNTSKTPSSSEAAPTPKPIKPAPPETPQWMNKFTGAGKGLPMTPYMDDEDSDDDRSVASTNTTASQEPEWLSQFNKVKTGVAAVEPRKIKAPPRNSKADEPEWIRKFHNRGKINTVEDTSGATVETIDSMAGPERKSSDNLAPGEEPEWMTRYREIGVHDMQESPSRRKPVFRPVQRMTAPNADLRKSNDHPTRVPPDSNSSFSGISNVSGLLKSTKSPLGANKHGTAFAREGHMSFSGGFMSAPASPVGNGKITVGSAMQITPVGGGAGGRMTAPSSPLVAGKAVLGGGVSAPSSPVSGSGTLLNPASLMISPGPPAVLRQRQLEESNAKPELKVIDPAAKAPEKLSWMTKVKAAAHMSNQQPEWMMKLKRRKQGLEEPGPRKGTPPWKRKERLKEEQAKKLREESGALPNFDDSIIIGDGEHSAQESSMNLETTADYKDDDEDEAENDEEEEENVPEWMRQFKKMHLQEAEVLSAQGRAPQGISRLRRGSIQMIERSNMYNPGDDTVKSMPAIVQKKPRKSKHNRIQSESSMSVSMRTDASASSSDLGGSRSVIDDTAQGKAGTLKEVANPEAATPQKMQAALKPTEPSAKLAETRSTPVLEDPKAEPNAVDSSSDSAGARTVETGPNYTSQVEIDNSKPENIMSMWGSTVKAKKPGNSTLMSFRMIQNQAEMVKERIARAKQKADNGGNDSDEDSIEDIVEVDSRPSVGMDNSAAALFGFAGGAAGTPKREPVSMENSAAALFGFGGETASAPKTAFESMDNSAAALFGFGKGQETSNSISMEDTVDGSKSSSMENSAAAMFGFQGGSKDGAEHPDSNTTSMENSAAALFGVESGAGTKTDDGKEESTTDWTKKQSIAEEDSDNSSDGREKAMGSTPVSQTSGKVNSSDSPNKKSSLDDSSSDDSDESSAGFKKSAEAPAKMKSAPASMNPISGIKSSAEFAPKKKSFLDDSDSEDSSDDDRPKAKAPAPILGKKSDDSDSGSDDDEKPLPKTAETTPTSAKNPSLEDSENDDDSSEEKPKPPASVPSKPLSAGGSDSEDSSSGEKKKPSLMENKAAPAPVKKFSLDDSDDEDSSDDEKPKTNAVAPSPAPVHGKKSSVDNSDSEDSSDDENPTPKVAAPTPAPAKKSSLDDSGSEGSSDDENPTPKVAAPTPAPAPTKKSSLNDSDSDDSSDDERPTAKVAAPTPAPAPAKKSSLDDSDNEDSSDNEAKAEKLPVPAPKTKSFLDESDSEDSSDEEKPKLAPIKLAKPAYEESSSPKKKSSGDNSSSDDGSDDSSTDRGKEKAAPKTESDMDWDQPDAKMDFLVEEEKKGQEKEKDTTTDDWGMGFDAGSDTKADKNQNPDAEWQAALLELAAEDQAKKEKAEQDAWQAALEGLAADEINKKTNDQDVWDAALKDLEADAEDMKGSKDDKKKDKPTEKESRSKDKDSDKTKSKDKVKDSKNKSKSSHDVDSKKDKDSKKKDKKDRSLSKSPKGKSEKSGLTGKEDTKKKSSAPSPFDASTFGASPFGDSPFGSSPSPFAPLGETQKSSDPSPFAPLGDTNKMDTASPFAPLGAAGKSDAVSPFAPLSESKGKKKKKGLAVKDSTKTKKSKSSMKLVVQTAKPKGDLHQKRSKKGKKLADPFGGGGDDDDDSFGDMNDFDDNFSVGNDFGDFAEDGSVVPLRAVRNAGPKAKTSAFAPKPPTQSSKKGKPNLVAKKAEKVKEKDKDPKSKEKDSRSRSKSTEKEPRSRSKSAEKKRGRSRSVGRRKALKKKGKE